MPRFVLTAGLILAAFAVLGVIYVDRRADFRSAQAEVRFLPEGNIINVMGRDVHVVVKGEGRDLVLIHGAGGSSRDMTISLGDRLSDRFRVFTIDRPGFGWSDRADPAYRGAFGDGHETPQEQAALLSAAVSALGAENPIVVGHSFGGAVAMGWALEHQASAIVVISGATMPWPGDIDITYRLLSSKAGAAALAPLVSAFIPKSYVSGALEGVFAPQSPPPEYYTRAGVPLAIRAETLRANARQVSGLRPAVVEMSKRYSSISLPVEILHGTADKTVYREVHAEPLHDLLPNSALTILDGIGHMPHHVASDDVIDAIERAASRTQLP